MSSNWETMLDKIQDSAALKLEIKTLLNDCSTEDGEFMQRQGAMLKKYLQQLADGTINADEFKDNILDLRSGVVSESLKLEVKSMARVQAIADKISSALLDRLLKLI